MEDLFAQAFASFEASNKTAEEEATFYSSHAYQIYYEQHFNKSYKEYITFTLDELDDEEEVLKDLRQTSLGLLVQIKQLKLNFGVVEYKLCCEIDAELDAVHAAYRRLTRSKSI